MSNYPVTVITVTFNSASPLSALLQTIPDRCRVIVVDNASEDDTVAIAEQSGATVISNRQNVGFACACNQGADATTTEFLLFLNPDTELKPNTIDELYRATKRHPSASAFAPTILNPLGNPAMMSKSLLVSEKQWLPHELPDTDFEVPAILGAAIFISKRVFEDVGKFDENIFLYYEDDDLCYRLRTQFGPIMVIRSAELMHLGRQSTPARAGLTGFRRYHFHRSKTYVARKHGIVFPENRKIIVFSLKLLVSCLVFSRKLQIKYYYSALGMLSEVDGNKFAVFRRLIDTVARIFKL